MNLLPYPRVLKRRAGVFILPDERPLSAIKVVQTDSEPGHPEGYAIKIDRRGVQLRFREKAGLRAASATLRQILREYGRKLPYLTIRDWPDFPRRGVMLDISRGRVPRLKTLLELAEKLADLKINELQLYTEHTFAYKKYSKIWQSWGAITGEEIKLLDARCRELGIDLVPNQNSFGHLRYFLADPRLKHLAEIPAPYEDPSQEFVRRPTTLAPKHPGTLPFLSELYREMLPNFSSHFFNVGCDETWDLGQGQSKKLCERLGKGRVYLNFLKKIHRKAAAQDRTIMFWGDIILKYPELIRELPENVIALNWGYEASHPIAKEAAEFAKAKIPFYVCPGTSTWQTLIGRHDNAFANLKTAARVGKKYGAIGFLNTDWGDGGHPQPLAVSWPLFAAGAGLAWNAGHFSQAEIEAVLSRDVYEEPAGKIAAAACRLGVAHLRLGVTAPNETPIGTVIAAPKPADRELFCRNGLKWFAKIPAEKIRATLIEIEKQRTLLTLAKTTSPSAKIMSWELDLAARMAAESCHFMLWQQLVAAGKKAEAKRRARQQIRSLKKLEIDFAAAWPQRNKGTPLHCSQFLKWRIAALLGVSPHY
jgi:hypothetical protein